MVKRCDPKKKKCGYNPKNCIYYEKGWCYQTRIYYEKYRPNLLEELIVLILTAILFFIYLVFYIPIIVYKRIRGENERKR
jgi:hypothetical protein